MEVLGHIRYEKIRQIGIGQGMNSEVWEAKDIHLAGTVAVKEIPRNNLVGVVDYFAEAKAMFASGHPNNVVPIKFACDCPAENVISIVMPFFRKGSLQDRISNGPLRPLEVVRIGLGMLNGLNQIHLAGYGHFDLKPSNITLATMILT